MSYCPSLTANHLLATDYADRKRRQARRSAGRATDQLQAGRQSQHRQGARPHRSAIDPRPRRRGRRVKAARLPYRCPGPTRSEAAIASRGVLV
jgi:hypothetical protein